MWTKTLNCTSEQWIKTYLSSYSLLKKHILKMNKRTIPDFCCLPVNVDLGGGSRK